VVRLIRRVTEEVVVAGQTPGSVRLAIRLLLGIVVASVLNTGLATFARAAGADPASLPGLEPGRYLTLTAAGVLAAAVGWWAIGRWACRPHASLRVLMPAGVLVALLADVPLFLVDGADLVGIIALLLMPVAVAVTVVPIFREALPLPGHDLTPYGVVKV
jgi:hypothetical protein